MTPGRRGVDEHVERAERGDLLARCAAEATLPRTRIGSAPSARQLRGGLLRGLVAAHVADRDAASRRATRSEARSPSRSRAILPSRGRKRPSKLIRRGSGSGVDTGADDGIGLPADPAARLRRSPSRGERRRVPEPVEQLHLLLAVPAHRMVGRAGPAISSRTRARSWYAKCGVAGPTSASMSSRVGSAMRDSLTVDRSARTFDAWQCQDTA